MQFHALPQPYARQANSIGPSNGLFEIESYTGRSNPGGCLPGARRVAGAVWRFSNETSVLVNGYSQRKAW